MSETELYNRNEGFWRNYNVGRPKFPMSFFHRLYDYHQGKGGSFETINDVGAGIGHHSKQLAKRFHTVILTEPAPQAIATAESLLNLEQGNYRFFNAAAEEETQVPDSVDAIFICNTLHWLDVERFVETAARQLKSGGTLFAALVAFPHFDDRAAQQAWTYAMDSTIRPFMEKVGESRVKAVLTLQDNACDIVDLSGKSWEEDVTRLRLNCTGNPLAFVQSPWASQHLQIQRTSYAQSENRVIEADDEDWTFEMTVDEIRALVTSYPFDPEEELLNAIMKTFEDLANKNGGRLTGRWPVSILMASKK